MRGTITHWADHQSYGFVTRDGDDHDANDRAARMETSRANRHPRAETETEMTKGHHMKRKSKPITAAERRAAMAGYKQGGDAMKRVASIYYDFMIAMLEAMDHALKRKTMRIDAENKITDIIMLRGLVAARMHPTKKAKRKRA
jgi:hypothetical protein